MKGIKIYRFDDPELDTADFYAAENLGAAKREYLSDISEDVKWSKTIKTRRLTARELNEYQIEGGGGKEKISFAAALEQLVNEGATFPRAFASEDY